MYKMAAVYTLVVRATWEQRAIAFVYACSEGIFSVSGLLTAAKNLSNANAPNSLIKHDILEYSSLTQTWAPSKASNLAVLSQKNKT